MATDSNSNNDFICPACEQRVASGIKFCPSCGTPIVHAPNGTDEWIGRIVAGKYRVEELVGEGGMGQVFRATQLSLDKAIVLKVLRRSLLSDARTVARFQREAKAASRLNHPNAIGIIDFGQDSDDSLYIAMEYVPGKDLHQILTEDGPIPERRLIKIAAQVLGALTDAHAVGVIHRDLKPENIMVEQRRDQTDFVKVLDFGIAKLQETSGSEGQALTRAGFVCGTPEYMSPEQASGSEIDARSDLYSVGVILYQCLTGVLPFDAESPVALASMHLTTEPVPPREKNPKIHCSDGLEKLILRAMAKDPADRPQSAEQFKSELIAIEKSQRAAAKREASARRHNKGAIRLDEGADSAIPEMSGKFFSGAISRDASNTPSQPMEARTATSESDDVAATGSLSKPGVVLGVLIAFAALVAVVFLSVFSGGIAANDPVKEVALGDQFFKEKKYEEALLHYRNASKLQPSAAHTKREALVHLAMGNERELAESLKLYQMQSGGAADDGDFVEHYLEAYQKGTGGADSPAAPTKGFAP